MYPEIQSGRYYPFDTHSWDVPPETCDPLTRSTTNIFGVGSYCAIPPTILDESIKVNASSTYQIVGDGEIANLTFNTILDKDQEPLVRYSVLWDGALNTDITSFDHTTVAGVQINSRPEEDNPHSVFHLYEYGDLLDKEFFSLGSIECNNEIAADPPVPDDVAGKIYCRVRPRLLVEDNWGWCTNGWAIDELNSHPCDDELGNFVGDDVDPNGVYIYVTLE